MKQTTLLLFLMVTTLGFAQNLITNGTFDDATGWTVVNQWGTDSTNGSVTIAGGAANIGKINPADGGWIHMGLYTSVYLTPGWYQFDMNMTYTGINDIWGEVYIGTAQPVNNAEYNGNQQVIKAYNAWDCGSIKTYSGSAVAAGCDTSSPGKFQITSAGTYYLLFRTGGGTYGASGITLDNWSLVADVAQPVANFYDGTSVSNLMATFTNTSTDATSYTWDFGDGSTSTDANPAAHTYAYKGQYLVSLTATSTAGSNTTTKEIFVGAVTTPVSDFSFDFSLPTPLRNERLLSYVETGGVAIASGVNNDWWSQVKYINNAGIDLSSGNKGFSIKVKGPRTSTLTIKVEDGGTEHAVTANYTTPNEWQKLTFDFSSFTSNNNKKIALFFDIQTNFDASVDPNLNIFQIDDYVFGEFATWTGNTNSNWADATNWNNGIPSVTTDVIIGTGTYQPIIASNAGVKSLTINNSASLTVASGNLTVVGAIANSGTMTLENNANLIQNGTTNSNTGNITVKRNSSTLLRSDYTLWSSPVASQNLLAFSLATTPTRFYNYNTGTNLYNAEATPGATSFTVGKGYLIRMPNTNPLPGYDAGTATLVYPGVFTGVPNNGDITALLVDGGSAGLRYNLVGNPYPSPITMSTFTSENSDNIESTLYFWRKTNGTTGSAYCTWVAGTFTGNGNAVDPAGVIQTGQGFFVEAKSGKTSLSFNNTQRVINTANQFFKTKQVAEPSKIWLNATDTAGNFSQMAVTYFDGATLGVDAFDAKYINDSKYALTSDINQGEYTIQGRPAFDASDVVALNFKTEVAGDYTIAIDHTQGVFANGQDVYLVDSKTGTETDLKAGPYTFTATAGIDNTRFSLKYQKTLKVDAPAFNENTVKVYKNNGTLYVNSGKMSINSIQVYDIQGRLIAERKNVKSSTATLDNLKANNQVLLVKISGEDNSVVTKKVLN
jgi:PKD repeat protein